MTSKLYLACVLWSSVAAAQSPVATQAATLKPLSFELASIRENKSGGPSTFGATPDGFRMTNMSLGRVILTAYVPQSGGAIFWEPVGFPAWVNKDRYDIQAKVSEADLPEWQKPASQTIMLRSMLQSLLADRCHLAVHREFKDALVYYLEVGKNGPKFKEAKIDDPSPSGPMPFPGGGVVVPEGQNRHFYQAPMTLLASYLTNMNLGGRPVQDRTGLTGRYNFVLESGWTAGMSADPGEASNPQPTLASVTAALGLKLEAAKGQEETLVLDHIDHPSEN